MSKYNNKKVTVDNIRFDSKDEALYYLYLKEKKRLGEVVRFELQPKFILLKSYTKYGRKIQSMSYTPDFYVEWKDGTKEYIDVKGMSTQASEMRRKLFDYFYPELTLRWVTRSLKYGKDGWIDIEDLEKIRKGNREMKKRKDKIIVVFCGKSGAGKTTLAKMISEELNITFLAPYTTRPKRPGETNKIDYNFVTEKRFNTMADKGTLVAKRDYHVSDNRIWKYGINKNHIKDINIAALSPDGVHDLLNDGYSVYSIYIDTNNDNRLERILKRKDNQGEDEIKRRFIDDDIAFKEFIPDYNIDNNNDLNSTFNHIKKIFQEITA